MTSVFLCADIRLHTFHQKPGYASAVRGCFLYLLWQHKMQDLIPAFAKEAKFSLISFKCAVCGRFSCILITISSKVCRVTSLEHFNSKQLPVSSCTHLQGLLFLPHQLFLLCFHLPVILKAYNEEI